MCPPPSTSSGAVLIESGTPAFHLIGFLSFLASALTEASRVVGVAMVLQGEQRYNSAESLIYISAPSAVALLLGSAIWEGQGIATKGPQVTDRRAHCVAAIRAAGTIDMTRRTA